MYINCLWQWYSGDCENTNSFALVGLGGAVCKQYISGI